MRTSLYSFLPAQAFVPEVAAECLGTKAALKSGPDMSPLPQPLILGRPRGRDWLTGDPHSLSFLLGCPSGNFTLTAEAAFS